MSFIPTAHKRAQPAAFSPLIAPFTVLFVLNLSNAFEIIVTIIKEGKMTAVVAINAPRIPEVVKPANVATLTPTGPGVLDEIASISVSCFGVYQWNFSAISYKNGNVAYPPPKEKTPTWKNCKNNRR